MLEAAVSVQAIVCYGQRNVELEEMRGGTSVGITLWGSCRNRFVLYVAQQSTGCRIGCTRSDFKLSCSILKGQETGM